MPALSLDHKAVLLGGIVAYTEPSSSIVSSTSHLTTSTTRVQSHEITANSFVKPSWVQEHVEVIVGVSFAWFILLVLLSAGVFWLRRRPRRQREEDLKRLIRRPTSSISSVSSFASPDPIARIRQLPPVALNDLCEKSSKLSYVSDYEVLRSPTISQRKSRWSKPAFISKATKISNLRMTRGTLASFIGGESSPTPLTVATPLTIQASELRQEPTINSTLDRINRGLGWERRMMQSRPLPPQYNDLEHPLRPGLSRGPSAESRMDVVAEFTISPFGEFCDLPYSPGSRGSGGTWSRSR